MLDHYKPGVNKNYLLFLSGLMWISVGILLLSFATHWLANFNNTIRIICTCIGIIMALTIHHFGFLRVVDKNLGRILPMEGKPCVFSFMSWKSYLIVAIMMTMGIMLRHSSVPKQYLSVIYIGIGLALFLSSIRYFRVLIIEIRSSRS
jgi:hypothetical protein